MDAVTKNKWRNFFATSQTNKIVALVIGVAIVGAGGYFLTRSFAAGFLASVDLNKGTVTGPAYVVNDSAGGQVVQFGPVVPTTPPPSTGGFPAAHNTGYPQGLPGDTRAKVTLKPYTGPYTITTAGTVIDGYDINDHIEIKAKNVTIKNSRIRVANVQAITITDDDANFRLEDSEVDGQLKDASTGGISLIGRTGFTILRANLHGSGDILRIDGRGTVQDSWLHDPGGIGSAQHNDVIQSTNAIYVRILHNRLENQHTQTSCILLKADIGPISDVVVDGNLMNGGGYTFYWYDANYKITNGKITNNRFMRQPTGGFWPKGGYYGTQAFQATTMPTWSGNVWDDTGEIINP